MPRLARPQPRCRPPDSTSRRPETPPPDAEHETQARHRTPWRAWQSTVETGSEFSQSGLDLIGPFTAALWSELCFRDPNGPVAPGTRACHEAVVNSALTRTPPAAPGERFVCNFTRSPRPASHGAGRQRGKRRLRRLWGPSCCCHEEGADGSHPISWLRAAGSPAHLRGGHGRNLEGERVGSAFYGTAEGTTGTRLFNLSAAGTQMANLANVARMTRAARSGGGSCSRSSTTPLSEHSSAGGSSPSPTGPSPDARVAIDALFPSSRGTIRPLLGRRSVRHGSTPADSAQAPRALVNSDSASQGERREPGECASSIFVSTGPGKRTLHWALFWAAVWRPIPPRRPLPGLPIAHARWPARSVSPGRSTAVSLSRTGSNPSPTHRWWTLCLPRAPRGALGRNARVDDGWAG